MVSAKKCCCVAKSVIYCLWGVEIMNERLKKLRSHFGLNQTEFAERTKISRSMIAAFELGTRGMKDIHISQICAATGVNEEWLKTGNGDMFAASDDSTIAALCDKHGFSPIERKMLEAYVGLDAKYREGVMRYVETLVASIVGATAKTVEEEAAEEAEAYRKEYIESKKRQTLSASDIGNERTV